MASILLDRLIAGTLVPFGGDRAAIVPPELAAAFQPGDHLIVLQESGALLRIPAAQKALAEAAIDRAVSAFAALAAVPDAAISRFFDHFAAALADDACWAAIEAANQRDVATAKEAGRSTTRLAVNHRMRADMVAGLRAWRDAAPARGRIIDRLEHPGWIVEQVAAPLGVVGFVFEGRPNVFADAAGVLRSGNAAVFRIGSDALGTAQAILRYALDPALASAGLPEGAVCLVESPDRAAGWALFADRRLSLAIARGSGPAVAQLGSVARQAGTAVSLHGTGGAWMVAAEDADAARFAAAVHNSLDRKVCNTLNVCCIVRARLPDLLPVFLESLRAVGDARGHHCKLHVTQDDAAYLPPAWRDATVRVRRAGGDREEALVEILAEADLGREWEWEETPEVTLRIVDDLDEAVSLCNRFSPHFVASLISGSAAAHTRFYETVDAPFVGDGFTRWVDGQYALNQPELGLSNWQGGRLLARGAILSGNGVFTVRCRVTQTDLLLHR
jgi:glutamate-5-semialdehyde dehydrogenase